MYQLSFAGLSLSIGTLLEVLTVFRTDSRLLAVESADIVLTHSGQPVRVIRHNGALTVRRPGTARDVFLSMIDEIDGAYFRPNGVPQAAWQIRRSHWKLLYDAFDLTSTPRLIFSSDQVEAGADARGRLDFFELLQGECERRFGFRYAGPEYGRTRQRNGRHEVHAYALAEGWPVPEAVLDEYRQLPDRFVTDMTWGRVLVDVPELRGAMSPDKFRVLARVMGREQGGISSVNAALLAMVMRLAPNSPSFEEVDDLLFHHGLVQAYNLPGRYSTAEPLGAPVSKFAEAYRRNMADKRRDTAVARLRKETCGETDLSTDVRSADADGTAGAWPRDLRAGQRDLGSDRQRRRALPAVQIMDCPDERNRVAKQTVREVFGIKLLGVRAAARRRGIFALAGYDEACQAQWEAAGTPQARQRVIERHQATRAAASVHPAVFARISRPITPDLLRQSFSTDPALRRVFLSGHKAAGVRPYEKATIRALRAAGAP